MSEERALRVVAARSESGEGTCYHTELEAPMKTAEVWEMLCGALVTMYRTVLVEQGMTLTDFLDQTLDMIEKLDRGAKESATTLQ